MTDLGGDRLSFGPSRRRYWIVGPFVTIEGLFILWFLALVASTLANAIRAYGFGLDVVVAIIIGATFVWIGAFVTSYVRNAATLSLVIDRDTVRLRTGAAAMSVPTPDIDKICFLDTLKGWMYIIIYSGGNTYTMSNMMFFDKEFTEIRDDISAFFKKIGRPDVVYSDSVTSVGWTRNRKLPPFIYAGIWKCILAYVLLLMAMTAAWAWLGVRPATPFAAR